MSANKDTKDTNSVPAQTHAQPQSPMVANRRNFLLGATVGAAGAVAVAVTTGAKNALDIAQPTPAVAEATKPRGYHMSEHIAQYYDTTRI